jgi:hypothetical protein
MIRSPNSDVKRSWSSKFRCYDSTPLRYTVTYIGERCSSVTAGSRSKNSTIWYLQAYVNFRPWSMNHELATSLWTIKFLNWIDPETEATMIFETRDAFCLYFIIQLVVIETFIQRMELVVRVWNISCVDCETSWHFSLSLKTVFTVSKVGDKDSRFIFNLTHGNVSSNEPKQRENGYVHVQRSKLAFSREIFQQQSNRPVKNKRQREENSNIFDKGHVPTIRSTDGEALNLRKREKRQD